ncbi:hypothetical protein BGZ61DRAFT_180290 [Ilyonectria robusta]|uniref:uncharacterized protein n=1 Tax=Ilyonectria robusta TaxID=1079257 RepID=UPI001E8E5420|nr:uncharacterized protein BGZ61DRAFT_180290 [Ilyonectria robusta]KAH8729373.1 hypothetical protein BGZ61DRAFT_180290 [Ilyonectria robusta]
MVLLRTLLHIILSHPSLSYILSCILPPPLSVPIVCVAFPSPVYTNTYLPFSIFLIPSIPRAIDQAKPRPLPLSPSPHRSSHSHRRAAEAESHTTNFDTTLAEPDAFLAPPPPPIIHIPPRQCLGPR